MPENKAKTIADAADMIVDGYAMKHHKQGVRIVNLHSGHVSLVSKSYEILATDMDDIEAMVAVTYLKDNIQFMAA